ncbi:septal ring lytic transglycosylase RlpA family protein [Actinomadura sp. BRA 177]|uniref:septal ring lytic transglycosylase RlpA family protein n=1 Tax=Actinomadura sp. BRA 177 TaxID=2745202 RepID=UPI0015962906|nr:septal ring lytic transglycosylase RlpA family protein [Actinomadura sp. BRA 177]NVI87201.1 septal ring lytic transglycosylase RlpA family protein [Actinomadura sp. BRA 177]
MGSPVRRLLRARLRTVLIVSGAAVAVLAAGAFALVNGNGTARSAQAAQTAPPAADPLAGRPKADPPRASRGKPRSPEPSPTKSPEKKAAKSDTKVAHLAKPEKKTEKKRTKVISSGSCEASYYWEGQMTASGEPFDPSELTAAHKTLPMGSKVRVTNKNNGRSVVVRINDRGPYAGGRCLDLSRAAMKKVGGTGAGVIPVRYEVLSRG